MCGTFGLHVKQQLSKLKVGSLRMCSMFTRLAPQVYEVTQASTTHSVFPSFSTSVYCEKTKAALPNSSHCHQCSATEPWQADNHQPSQSSICTAQVVLNASVTHLAATQHVPSEPHYGFAGKFSPSGKNRLSWLSGRALVAQPEVSGFNSQIHLFPAWGKMLWGYTQFVASRLQILSVWDRMSCSQSKHSWFQIIAIVGVVKINANLRQKIPFRNFRQDYVTVLVAWQPYKSKTPPAVYIVYPCSNSQGCSNFQLVVVRTHQLG